MRLKIKVTKKKMSGKIRRYRIFGIGVAAFIVLAGILWLSSIAGDSGAGSVSEIPSVTAPDRFPQLNKIRPIVTAESAVLIDRASGNILYDKKAHQRMYPASTTKILTALIALEQCSLEETVKVGAEIFRISQDASRAGLSRGQEMSMRELLMALMLPSGNDAAYTVAVHVARKVVESGKILDNWQAADYFVNMMNNRAKEIGAEHSHFVNPCGYHDDAHYATAADIALIAREAMKNPDFRHIVRTDVYGETTSYIKEMKQRRGSKTLMKSRGGGGDNGARKDVPSGGLWQNRNLLLQKDSRFYFPDATGIKTGHTAKAGYCLVSSVRRGQWDLIAVVLNSTEEAVWTDSIDLLEYGLPHKKSVLGE